MSLSKLDDSTLQMSFDAPAPLTAALAALLIGVSLRRRR